MGPILDLPCPSVILWFCDSVKIFVTLFLGTVRPRRLKLGTHMDSGQMYRVYRNQTAAAYSSLYFFIFLSNFRTLEFFITLFSGTVRPRRLKLGSHVDSGQVYRVYWNRATAAYLSLYFFIFLSLQFSNIKIFRHTFLRNCEAYIEVETWYTMCTLGGCIVYTTIRLLLLICPLFLYFSLSLQCSKIKNFHHTFLRNCEAKKV